MRTIVFCSLLTLFLSLCALGCWQLYRAHEKELWLTTINAQQEVQLSGYWLQDTQFLWDNQMLQGQVGYHVLTPFQPFQGALVLVDRGWIQAPPNRNNLPSLPTLSDKMVTIKGQFSKPSVNRWISNPLETPVIQWPLRIQKLDWPTLNRLLNKPLNPEVFHLDPNAVDAFIKTQPQLWLTPAKHRGYAIQWFSLAATLLFLLYNYRRHTHASQKI
jgi:surfeit locus 1 family protein